MCHMVLKDNSKLIEGVLHFIQHITSDLNVMAGFLWIEPTVHYVYILHCCVTAVFSTAGAQVGKQNSTCMCIIPQFSFTFSLACHWPV